MKRGSGKGRSTVDTEAGNIGQASKNPRASQERYSEAEKRQAVLAALSVNRDHPTSLASREAARDVLGREMDIASLHSWLQQYGDEMRQALAPIPTNDELARQTYDDVLGQFVEIRSKVIKHLLKQDTIDALKGSQAFLSLGIIQTKIDEIAGLTPDEVMLFRRFKQAWTRIDYDYKVILEEGIAYAEKQHKERTSKRITAGETTATTDDNTIDVSGDNEDTGRTSA